MQYNYALVQMCQHVGRICQMVTVHCSHLVLGIEGLIRTYIIVDGSVISIVGVGL